MAVLAALVSGSSSPSPRSGCDAGEVVEVLRRTRPSLRAPLAGRGGEGRSRWWACFRFWCRWLSSLLLLRLTMVAWGAAATEDVVRLWSLWRWCSGAPAVGASGGRCVYRSCFRLVLAGCSDLGARFAEDGGSIGCFLSSSSAESGGAHFQGVRGVSPAVVVQRFSSRRLRARRVSPLVPQLMLPWSLGAGFVRCAALDLLFLCLFPVCCGMGRLVGVVMFLFDI